jgi:hypothetical protein
VAAGFGSPRDIGFRLRQQFRRAPEKDRVTIEAMDSFPASDAPSSNATTGEEIMDGLRDDVMEPWPDVPIGKQKSDGSGERR